MEPVPGALLTDLYQLTMIQAYLESGQTDTAVFEFFVRTRFGETASIRINERRGHFPAVFCFVVSPSSPDRAPGETRDVEIALRADALIIQHGAQAVRGRRRLDRGGNHLGPCPVRHRLRHDATDQSAVALA